MPDPAIRSEILALILVTGAANVRPLAPMDRDERLHAEMLADKLVSAYDFKRRGPDSPLNDMQDRAGIVALVLATSFTKSRRRSTRQGVDHGAEDRERSKRVGLLADKILLRFAIPARVRETWHKTPSGFKG